MDAGFAEQANLMQGRRGASWAEGVFSGVGRAALVSVKGLDVQANWIDRLRGASGLPSVESVPRLPCLSAICGASETFLGWKAGPWSRFVTVSGMGGLGVLVRAGLVKPVSLVRSAVEAKLTLLAMDRRRRNSGVEWY